MRRTRDAGWRIQDVVCGDGRPGGGRPLSGRRNRGGRDGEWLDLARRVSVSAPARRPVGRCPPGCPAGGDPPAGPGEVPRRVEPAGLSLAGGQPYLPRPSPSPEQVEVG